LMQVCARLRFLYQMDDVMISIDVRPQPSFCAIIMSVD